MQAVRSGISLAGSCGPACEPRQHQATRRTIPAAAAPDSELRISLDQSLPDAVEQLERTMVQAALDRTNGRLEEAAKILGISRKGLFLKRRRWGLQGG